MAFERPITIREVITNIHQRHYLLPAIQREFVWSTEQIELLFDSLMRNYPVGSFLFWEVKRQNVRDYQFYEFIRDYHQQDNRHNPKANVDAGADIIAILDGQQRFTSLYLGLKGSYAYKLPWKRWNNRGAFPKRHLYLNLLSAPPEGDRKLYDFRFLTGPEATRRDETTYWFKVGDVLDLEKPYQVGSYIGEHLALVEDKSKVDFAHQQLYDLQQLIHHAPIVNYFLEKDESLDKVLNIFIRVNSLGTELSYSDLLLSIATAQWQDKDAREEITAFVDNLNSIGDGFNFNKDFVLKSCLVLSDIRDIAFKVDNFNHRNMAAIEEQWDKITHAIESAVILAHSFGYHRDTLTSNNALIPIAYYLYKIGLPENYALSSRYKEDRERIFKWLVVSLLKRTFSGHTDTVLRTMREVVDTNYAKGFPLEEIYETFKGTPKSLAFAEEEIDNLLFSEYGKSYTYSVLAFLYPSFNFRNKFHADHIYPKSLFTPRRLRSRGIPEEKLDFYLNHFNRLVNLQLLEGIPNQEKSDKDFKDWLCQQYPNLLDRQRYMETHYIPNVELDLEHFEEFIRERSNLLRQQFMKLVRTERTDLADFQQTFL